ncbi:hypothetical protein N7535_004541 [Penicillium sp. DV-2018c]|nr:hypothetical protein N7535_004541 [Penicillium sp. DV-2018c]
MLFNKSIFALAALALANVAVAGKAQTPACVLKIIGNQPNPADAKTICGSSAEEIQSDISKACPESETSLKFFVSNCAQLGHEIAPSSVMTPTATGGSATATGFITTASGSATKTGGGAGATGTGGAGGAGATGGGAAGGGAGGATETSGAGAGAGGSATESGGAAEATSTFNAASSDRQFSATSLVAAVFLGAAALL